MMGLFNFEYVQTGKIDNKRSPQKKFNQLLSRNYQLFLPVPCSFKKRSPQKKFTTDN
ncbi:MAG: hypothetical protein SWX82_33320 [Cyanobacteriota bacterium]|nr:hypothetical protein [Cyanobacteriota bacterium]